MSYRQLEAPARPSGDGALVPPTNAPLPALAGLEEKADQLREQLGIPSMYPLWQPIHMLTTSC